MYVKVCIPLLLVYDTLVYTYSLNIYFSLWLWGIVYLLCLVCEVVCLY